MQLSISKLCSAMREYQKNNNIVEQCMTNTQTLYDIVKLTYPDADVKAIPVICLNYIDVSDAVVKTAENCCFTTLGQSCFENLEEDDTPILKQTIHLILKVNDIFYEPSYELYTAKARYFTSIKNLLDDYKQSVYTNQNLNKFALKYNPSTYTLVDGRLDGHPTIMCNHDFVKEHISEFYNHKMYEIALKWESEIVSDIMETKFSKQYINPPLL